MMLANTSFDLEDGGKKLEIYIKAFSCGRPLRHTQYYMHIHWREL